MSEVKKHCLELVMVCWVILTPVHPALICALVLPIVDFALALAVARRDGKRLSSSGVKRSFAKVSLYLAGIVLAFLAETYLSVPYAIHVMTSWVGLTELTSCLEHLDELYGTNVFKVVLDKLTAGKAREDDDAK